MSADIKKVSLQRQKRPKQPKKSENINRRVTSSHSHELTSKESEEKRPFLKKRSGLFRFYKCMPTGLAPGSSNKAARSSGAGGHRMSNIPINFDPSIAFQNSMNSRRAHHNNNSSNTRRNSDGNQRSSTYSTGPKDLLKCSKYKPEIVGAGAVYEGNDSAVNAHAQKPSCKLCQHDEHAQGGTFDPAGDAQKNLINFGQACCNHGGAESPKMAIKARNSNSPNCARKPDGNKREVAAALKNSLLWPPSKTCNVDHEDSGRKGSIVSDDFIEEELLEDEVIEEDEKYDEEISLDDDLSQASSSSVENFDLKENAPQNVLKSPNVTSQLAQLQQELLAMKSKVTSLEMNLEKTATPKKQTQQRLKKEDSSNKNSYNSLQGIHSSLEKMTSELSSIQNGFLQKLENLEEEMHVKSQRWCENQIQLADKVHSLFSELEVVSNRLKSQQHQVQNLAENVEKEFESLKNELKESRQEIERRLEAVEGLKFDEKFDQVQSSSQIGDTVRSTGEFLSKDQRHSPRIQGNSKVYKTKDGFSVDLVPGPEPNAIQPVPSSNNSCIQYRRESSGTPQLAGPPGGDSSEPKLESIRGQLVSARKTLENGDVETVYTNGTREVIKADKSEIRHIYRNGDARTVGPDGTVTYFYAESSTWQTTFPTGVEFFKFPNGVTERRLPNGLIEQTDVNGRVTFFQQAPAKPLPLPAPPLVSPPKIQSRKSHFEIPTGSIQYHNHPLQMTPVVYPFPSSVPKSVSSSLRPPNPPPKLAPGERIIVFENGEEEIHGPDYRKKIFSDGTIKTVYQDGSQETRYPNGRIRIKDGEGNLVADVTVPHTSNKGTPVRIHNEAHAKVHIGNNETKPNEKQEQPP